MIDFEIEIPVECAIESLEAEVEAWANSVGLTCTLKSSLCKFPGSVHWHFKRGATRGTLEATLSPSQRRLWCSVQAGRVGDWQEEAAIGLQTWIRG